jgi:hypothetical protein
VLGEDLQGSARDCGSGVPSGLPDVRSQRRVDERGAVAILALIYIVAIGLIVTALAAWAANDLSLSRTFKSSRSTSYALSGAMNVAVQSIRSTPLLTDPVAQNVALPLSNCWTPVAANSNGVAVSQVQINGVWVAVWCSTTENLNSPATRIVNFYACQSTLTSVSQPSDITAAANSCQSSPKLKAVVTFDDYPPGGSTPLTGQCNVQPIPWCGEGSTVNSWIWA